MAKLKAIFYLPIKDNDGRDLTAERADLETELYVCFVGWTFLGYVKGTYRMADGTRVLDESAAYAVVLEESRLSELENILRGFRSKTLQEAIYLEIQHQVDIRFVT